MMTRVHAFITGILINIQFFTTIPLKKKLPMDRIHMKYTLRTFPILGLLQGGVYAGTVFLLSSYTPLSHLVLTLRSEEHTSELQSRGHLVCRLLLEKKKIKQETIISLHKIYTYIST